MTDRLYRGVVGAGRVALRALDLRVDLTGDDHVPRQGPVVLAANHVSFLDFLLVGLTADRSGRLVRFLARHEVFEHRASRRLMTGMGHVPVDRRAPAAAYLHARRLLREGEAVGVFPEAGVSRSWTVRALMPGAVALARETGAPLLPVAVWGPQRLLTAKQRPEVRRGRPVTLVVGRPLDVSAAAGVDDAVEGTRLLGADPATHARRGPAAPPPPTGGGRAGGLAPRPPRRARPHRRRGRGPAGPAALRRGTDLATGRLDTTTTGPTGPTLLVGELLGDPVGQPSERLAVGVGPRHLVVHHLPAATSARPPAGTHSRRPTPPDPPRDRRVDVGGEQGRDRGPTVHAPADRRTPPVRRRWPPRRPPLSQRSGPSSSESEATMCPLRDQPRGGRGGRVGRTPNRPPGPGP